MVTQAAKFEAISALGLQIVTFLHSFSSIERLDASAGSLDSAQRLNVKIENLNAVAVSDFIDRVCALAETEDALVIISDQLASEIKRETGPPANLAYLLRDRYRSAKAILYFLGIEPVPTQGSRFVDQVIDASADKEIFSEALRRAYLAICYRRPPSEKNIGPETAIEVGVVRTLEDFRKCLALRHDVYSLLGYIHDDVDEATELDYYDPSAMHFFAVASNPGGRSFVGAARLVIAGTKLRRRGLFSDTAHTRQTFSAFCDQIASPDPHLRRKLEEGPGGAALPVLAAFNFGGVSPGAGVSVSDLCELSRVVVTDEFRGLGLSRLLVRVAIAAAIDLNLKYILLDCIPQHVVFYEKFGFETIREATPKFAWSIDREAVVMRLQIKGSEDGAANRMAKRDIAMMQVPRTTMSPPGTLCLCHNSECWRSGEYWGRGGNDCPLKPNFVL
jgi:GNAT superfamily N-acetyltransferase